MLQIKTTTFRNLDDICQEHYDNVRDYILRKLPILSNRQRLFISKRLKEIITAKPANLIKLNKEYINECQKPGQGRIKNPKRLLNRVINYSWFSNKETTPYNGYRLAQLLQVSSCPYCNRNYTVTVIHKTKKITRPDFDHFFAKNEYPLLALSFYNLIPSCLICNRTIKNQAKVKYGKYIHPYEEGYDDAYRFNYQPNDTDSSLGLNINLELSLHPTLLNISKAAKAKENSVLFKIEEIYNASHRGEVADIIRKHYVSGGRYLENLRSTFPKLGSIDEIYRIAFGAYYHLDEFEKRPLSKLTKDIVEQLAFFIL